ncbi:MAG: hypothetical protein K6G15_11295 [Desulfovibrio sp.]|nr:hypothetical protein [Desulfovibrio sp.]
MIFIIYEMSIKFLSIISPRIQEKEKKEVVNLLFALEAFFQLGVTLALTSTFDEREFLEGLGLL